MKKIVIFAGTTEGRRLSEILADAGIAHTVCVATEYGEKHGDSAGRRAAPCSPSSWQNGPGADAEVSA